MKYKITNFYNIRFFKPYQIPISTAVWDPSYFHDNCGQAHCFIDKNGVMNGIREEMLSPKYISKEHQTCQKDCPYREINPECPFLLAYRKYLATVAFDALNCELERTCKDIKKVLAFKEEPECILIVYETENNPCSERNALKDYFKKNGVELTE